MCLFLHDPITRLTFSRIGHRNRKRTVALECLHKDPMSSWSSAGTINYNHNVKEWQKRIQWGGNQERDRTCALVTLEMFSSFELFLTKFAWRNIETWPAPWKG